jgi:hypothetical protein
VLKKGCATFALIFLLGGRARAKAGASRGLRCACAKANRVHMVFQIYHSTLTSFSTLIILFVEIFKFSNIIIIIINQKSRIL